MDSDKIRASIKTLAKKISSVYPSVFELIGVLDASFMFVADLCRELHRRKMFPRVHFVSAKSYRGTRPGRKVKLCYRKMGLKNRYVLIVDTIVDTGNTVKAILKKVCEEKPCFIGVCSLISRVSEIQGCRLFYAFEDKSDAFYIGYGLDYLGYFRELPKLISLPRTIKMSHLDFLKQRKEVEKDAYNENHESLRT